jgi:ribosomal protein L12E/L44/L45/RPP1/RPP2
MKRFSSLIIDITGSELIDVGSAKKQKKKKKQGRNDSERKRKTSEEKERENDEEREVSFLLPITDTKSFRKKTE